jgi:hypothetical protein
MKERKIGKINRNGSIFETKRLLMKVNISYVG